MRRTMLIGMAALTLAIVSLPLTAQAAGNSTKVYGLSNNKMATIKYIVKPNINCEDNIVLPENPKPEAPKPEIPKPETPSPETPNPENPKPENPTPETPGNGEDLEDGNEKFTEAEQVVRLVNVERAKEGLQALKIEDGVEKAALVRAKEIVNNFSHTRPNGSEFSSVLKENNVRYNGAGENIAWGQKTPEQVVEGWMNSPSHRANIMNERYTTIGVGHYQNSAGVPYWVQLFTY